MLLLRAATYTFAKRSSHHFFHVPRTGGIIHRYGDSIRPLATPPPMTVSSDLPVQKYHMISDETMDSLLTSLEVLVDSITDKQCEVEYSGGVLTLTLGSKGTYVINKQPPNKQIWLSSPVSGPKRYDYSEDSNSWIYSRDGNSLGSLLRDELSSLLETRVDINLN